MDNVDLAQIEINNNDNINIDYRKDVMIIKPNGTCHFCFTDIIYPKIFCNSTCAKSYEEEKKIHNRLKSKKTLLKFKKEKYL